VVGRAVLVGNVVAVGGGVLVACGDKYLPPKKLAAIATMQHRTNIAATPPTIHTGRLDLGCDGDG
jgi:hypothetical protein